MRFRPVLVAALLSLALAGALAAPGVAGSSGAGVLGAETAGATGSSAADAPATAEAPDAVGATSVPFDRADPGLVVTIQLRENGDARWHVTHRFDVNGSNETAAFESFADSVVDGDRTIGTEVQTFSRFAAAASEASGRNMSIEDAGWRSSSLENGTGELTYSFTWTNFGQVEDDRMVIGDAFRSPDGTWLPRLYDGQRLVIRPPPSLTIVGTPPDKGVTDRALVWNGYREFAPGYLEVVLQQPSQPRTTVTTVPPTTTTIQEGDWELSPFLLGVGFALLLVLVGAGSYLFARWQTERDDEDGDEAPGSAAGGGGSDGAAGGSSAASGGSGDAATGGAGGAESTGVAGGDAAVESGASGDATRSGDAGSTAAGGSGASNASGGGAAADAATTDDAAEGDEADAVDETLLSDEERVLRLLEENGGRMKQANIVSETGWSNAKVSQLLSGMAEDEDVQKLRIGRENLITLPDENVADFGSDDQ
jgi:hypothetical protein